MQLTDETPVKITNNSAVRFEVEMRPATTYGASTVYVLGPNETVFWTWRVAKHWLGNPQTVTSRSEFDIELNRARGHFGGYIGDYTAPDVTVHTMEGQPIVMAIQLNDPNGPNADFSTGITPDDMAGRMAALQAEIDLLRSNMSGDLPPSEALQPGDPDAGTDTTLTSLTDLPTDDSVTPGRPAPAAEVTPAPAKTGPAKAPAGLTDK
jgi:hypothetical protein